MFKGLIFFCLWLFSLPAFSIPVGFNQAWFKDKYAIQFLDEVYDPLEVNRIFSMAQGAGAQSIRIWFFEGATFPMLKWEQERIVGIREDYIRNVIRTLESAKKHGLKVYMTFLDPQVYRPDRLSRDDLKRFRSVFQESGSRDFLENAIQPLFRAIEQSGLTSTIGRIDLSNEMDAAINRFAFNDGWRGAARFLCQWKAGIKKVQSFQSVPVSFSLRLHPLVPLPLNVLDDQGPMACADFLDFHSYGDSGQIHKCQRMKRYSASGKKELILGEFGQSYFNHRYSNELQLENTRHYIRSAAECGFKEALAWRLSDIRGGYNKEARYSFEAYGQFRPAYYEIQKNNRSP